MANPLYSLTWGEYGTSLVSAVQLLRCHGDLVDVTLAAGGRTFHAHKVVLCAASPFLLDLLKSTTCKHPVVMLAGVQACDLEALLEFVYRGEVSIDPNQLPSLLQAAHCLNIQGLAPVSAGHVQQAIKTVTDVPIQVQSQAESPTSQDDDVPIKRKKRVKRLLKSPNSPTQLSKWPKMFMVPESNENSALGQQDGTAQTWTQQIVNESNPVVDTLPLQQSLLVQNISTNTTQSTTSGPKIRGASDQPGACPLCGLMLRQARNLRRHLLTSCKYRMVNSQQTATNTVASQPERSQDSQLHQLQTISLQSLDSVTQTSMEHMETKPIALTPISCSELLPTNSSMISMTTNTLQ